MSNPSAPAPPTPGDPVDGYVIPRLDASDPATDPAVMAAAEQQAHHDAQALADAGLIHMDNIDGFKRELLDGFRNYLTGLGDPNRDKSLGGRAGGPDFVVRFITGNEAEDRWRGSDLGGRIVEKIPNEMTRRGWKITVQPKINESADLHQGEPPTPTTVRDALLRHAIRADLRGDFGAADRWRQRADDLAPEVASMPATPMGPPKHTPGTLPDLADDGTEIVEALEAKQRKLKAKSVLRQALCYERAYGGGAVLLGVDDGGADLTAPLDETRIKSVKHLTAYRGGWDGELIAWRYYNDPRQANHGEPEIYMLRNLGVPMSGPPAPGELLRQQPIPAGPTGAMIFYVHESRLLVFPGQQVSRRAGVQMRGWGDSVFTRVDEVLAQFGQTWSGISILMQEYSLPVLKMKGLAALLASKNEKDRGILAARAIAMQLAMSVARMRMIDSDEELTRLSVPMSGVAEVLREFALRLAAASDMPLSLLMGQTQGGLGDASKGDIRFFYDTVEGAQDDRLTPNVERLVRLMLVAADGPTKGVLPERWAVTMAPIYQMNDQERAAYRKMIAETDAINIDKGVVTPEEVAATRYGGSDFNDGPIVLDLEGRLAMASIPPEPPAPPDDEPPEPKQLTDSPDQPRVPKGQSGGGEFASKGGGGGGSAASRHASERLVTKALRAKGFTFDVINKAFPKEGFSVSIYPQHEQVIRPKSGEKKARLTTEDVSRYIRNKLAFVKATPGAHLGGWYNKKDGSWYLDVTHVVGTAKEATKLAKQHNQLAIFDLKNKKEIDTSGNS